MKSESEKLNRMIRFRVSQQECDKIKQMVENSDCKGMSDFFRSLLLFYEQQNPDLSQIKSHAQTENNQRPA